MTKRFQAALIAALVSISAIHSANAQRVQTRSVLGTVIGVFAKGGETTGTAIEQEDGQRIEADFSRIRGGAPAEGTEIRALGFFTARAGVLVPSRQVFVVTSVELPPRVARPARPEAEPRRQTIVGTIENVFARGGESTGTMIRTSRAAAIEADFSRLRLGSRLPQGRMVEAIGTFRTVSGELGERQVFTVQVFFVQLEGVLTSVAAIGNETTGTALRLPNDELVEIDLRQRNLLGQFREGRRVHVSGMFKSVPGLEIPMRQVLIVSRITGN